MNLLYLLGGLSALLLLQLFASALNEDLLLLMASLLFFGTLLAKVRHLLDDLLHRSVEEVYLSLSDLLLLKLARLQSLVSFGLRLLRLSIFLSPLLATASALLLRPSRASTLPPLLGQLQLLRLLRRSQSSLDLLEEQLLASASALLHSSLGRAVEQDLRVRAKLEQWLANN
jgi:hypothetical protein